MTVDNIISGFQATGIAPFNPDKIPTKAYVPNTLYFETAVQNANAATEQLPDVSIYEPTGVQLNVDLELNVVSTHAVEPSTSTAGELYADGTEHT